MFQAEETSPSTISRSANQSMQAIVQEKFGSADTLNLGVIARPGIGADEVLVEIVAAGVDRGTWHVMTGQPYLIRVAGYGFLKPKAKVPGFDMAGRVVAVGADVTRFAIGDEVFGIANGAFAEYAAASESKVAQKPSNVTFEDAAVAAVSGITALQALTEVGKLRPGQDVLIIGASGGVGTYALQLAKAFGGRVTAVVGTRNVEMVRSLGANRVIDYRQEDFVATGDRFDLILDIGGRNSVSRLRSALAERGTLVIVGGEGGNKVTGGIGRQLGAMVLSLFVKQRMTTFISKEQASYMEQLAGYMESGVVESAIGQRFGLSEVPKAIRMMEAGETSGKSVVLIGESSEEKA